MNYLPLKMRHGDYPTGDDGPFRVFGPNGHVLTALPSLAHLAHFETIMMPLQVITS